MHAWASTTPPGDDALAFIAHRHVAFRTGQDRRPPDCLFRSSMSLPAYAPVNASSAPSRTPSHDSDSRWLAIPFLATLSFATPRRFIPTLSARLDVSIPSTFSGQRGCEPRFLDMAPLI